VLLGSAAVRRVSVVGTSGAGKSTLSRALADALDAATRDRLEAAMADQGNSHLEFVRLTTPAAVRRFLHDLRR